MDELRNYLMMLAEMKSKLVQSQIDEGQRKRTGLVYTSSEDFVLKNGREYPSQPLNADEWSYLRECFLFAGNQWKIKQCFYNSQMLMLLGDKENRMHYVEGYVSGLFAIHHGWLDLNGKVIDVTLRFHDKPPRGSLKRSGNKIMMNRALGDFVNREYIGVKFDREHIRTRVVEHSVAGSLIDDWEANYPALHGKLEEFIVRDSDVKRTG